MGKVLPVPTVAKVNLPKLTLLDPVNYEFWMPNMGYMGASLDAELGVDEKWHSRGVGSAGFVEIATGADPLDIYLGIMEGDFQEVENVRPGDIVFWSSCLTRDISDQNFLEGSVSIVAEVIDSKHVLVMEATGEDDLSFEGVSYRIRKREKNGSLIARVFRKMD